MKKIEETLMKSEHKVKAYVCYVSSYRAVGNKNVSVYSRLYDDGKCLGDCYGIYPVGSKVVATFVHLCKVVKNSGDLDLITIRDFNKTSAYFVREAINGDIAEKYAECSNAFVELTNGIEVIVEVPNWCTSDQIDYEVEKQAKEIGTKIPSKREFFDYCISKNWTEMGLKEELYQILWEKGWKTKKGKIADDWRILACAYNSTLRTGKDAKYGKVKRKQGKNVVARQDRKEGLPDYVCYTDGSCDNMSYHKAGGSAYIVVNAITGKIEKVKTYHRLHTTSNRMEMLAIVSAVNACPKGSTIEVRTDSKYSIKMFHNTKWIIKPEIKNPDLIKKFRECSEGKRVILTWVKGHNGDELNEQADCLAFGAYEQALKENGLPLAPEKYRAMRRGKQTVFETA